MRTTLSLDDDIAKLVEQEVKRSGDTFKGTVNRLLRQGLNASRKPQPRQRFVVTPKAVNTGLGTRYRNVADLLEALDGPMHR